jgi:hypothetical protein
MESFGRLELLSRSENLREPSGTVIANPPPAKALEPRFLKIMKFGEFAFWYSLSFIQAFELIF